MMYYKLNHSLILNEVGPEFPQIQKMTKGYDYDSPTSVYALSRYIFKFPDFEPDLNSLVLHRSAKLTDLLSAAVISSACGMLVSEKLMNVFKKFQSISVKYYPGQVLEKNRKRHHYFWMHIAGENLCEKVDYSSSSFFADSFGTRVESIKADSLADLLNKRNKIREKYSNRFLEIKGERIVIDRAVSKYALFSLDGFDFDYYVSQELKDEILSHSITGIDLNTLAPFTFSDL